MNLAKKLFELQSLDLEMKKITTSLDDIANRLSDDSTVRTVKADLTDISKELAEIERTKKDLEWGIDELQKNIRQLDIKLFAGSIKNPKELLNLEQEKSAFKSKLKEKEDSLLDVMGKEESLQDKKLKASKRLKQVEDERQKEQQELSVEKKNLEHKIETLDKQRLEAISGIDSESMKIYERICTKKGHAVVRVEQGKCQGCRITLSISEMQHARGGVLVQCSSCGMILYLA